MCDCEKENVQVELDYESYITLFLKTDKHGVRICACGENEVEWEPNYCPLCGRKLK